MLTSAISHYQKYVIYPKHKENVAKEKRTSVYFDRKSHKFVGITSDQLTTLKDGYPGIDVDAELKRMALWLDSDRGKLRRGDINFIMNWLTRTTPSRPIEQLEMLDDASPLRPLLEDYLKDLWKGREHILQFNKKRL